jgi:hypothetical protein
MHYVELGASVQPGAPVAAATSTGRPVSFNLVASQQASVKAGDRVQITLPDGRATPGVVTAVGKVASGDEGDARAARLSPTEALRTV